jgi:hypothetical protein
VKTVCLGYFVAMPGVQEVHLLNITVDPDYQRQGWGVMMLDALSIWSRGQDAKWLWLEVRASNQRAIHVYERYGFKRVGERKNYYPLQSGPTRTCGSGDVFAALSLALVTIHTMSDTLQLDKRQRAMLAEMGVRVWTPVAEDVPLREAGENKFEAKLVQTDTAHISDRTTEITHADALAIQTPKPTTTYCLQSCS